MKFVATYTTCAQVGENSWQEYKMSKVFDYVQPLSDVMMWLESLGVKEPNLSCVELSDLIE